MLTVKSAFKMQQSDTPMTPQKGEDEKKAYKTTVLFCTSCKEVSA